MKARRFVAVLAVGALGTIAVALGWTYRVNAKFLREHERIHGGRR